jgi:hypothetical protein
MINDEYKNCPFCDEIIKAAAIKCKYCKSNLNEDSIKETEKIREKVYAANIYYQRESTPVKYARPIIQKSDINNHFKAGESSNKKVLFYSGIACVIVLLTLGIVYASNLFFDSNESLVEKVNNLGNIANINEANVMGNSAGNIANVGFAAIQGDWIYYVNDNDGYSIYKIRTDGTGRVKINDDSSRYLNVVGDWIYYSNIEGDSDLVGIIKPDHGYNIYKIRTDGSERIKLNNDLSKYLTVVDDWIYYTQAIFNGEKLTADLYKIRVDGSNPTKLSDDIALDLNVVDDWIYYTNESDSHRIYKVRTDGSERTQITYDDDVHFNINVVGEWIYSNSMVRAENLIRIRTDSGEPSGFKGIRYAYDLNYANGWLYYYNRDDNNSIYKVRIDGSEIIKVNDDSSWLINIVGDWIYYINSDEGDKFYRIKTDGSERQKVN